MTAACSLGLIRRCSGTLSWRMLYILAGAATCLRLFLHESAESCYHSCFGPVRIHQVYANAVFSIIDGRASGEPGTPGLLAT